MAKSTVRPPLQLASKMCETHNQDGFFGVITRGVQRIGKSSYTAQGMAQALGEWDWHSNPPVVKSNFEAVKPWVVFKPIEFLDVVLKTYEKEKGLFWDDAGYWLFSLDWYEPFVKSVSKYMQVAGTQFACIVLTTPNVNLISGKVLASLPNHYLITVVEDHTAWEKPYYLPRLAKAYQKWTYPDGKPGGVRTKWEDYFNAMLPDDFFAWYKPKRDSYLQVAKKIMGKEVRKLTKQLDKKEEAELMETVHKVVGPPERLAELTEVIATLETP